MHLRDGSTADDPRLDRLPRFDPRSRDYPITAVLTATTPRSYTWPLDIVLDQGREGACVGYAIAHELRAVPRKVAGVTATLARTIYHRAQQIDPWPGGSYPGASPRYEGTSVLDGLKAAQEQGHISQYRWAFSVDDLAVAVSRTGPAVLGIPWHASMHIPTTRDGRYWITPTGPVVGGHAILARGYNVRLDAFALHNSWGPDWGGRGVAWITRPHLAALLADNGEAAIPIVR